jgi:predicted dehydrogenase
MTRPLCRRDFVRGLTASALATAVAARATGRPVSANEKLNIGVIGTSGRAHGNIEGVLGENIVAVCDIDDRLLASAKERFPAAATFVDFRKLIERKDIDAVVISTADHTHAPAAVVAMKLGKHVYCEKPLSHSVYEARVIRETAAQTKVATQMGTQIHAGDNYRRVVEVIKSGAIGPVREAHTWVAKTWSGGERPSEKPPIPGSLHWDLWLGPAPARPYHPTYQPANWRRWWDFGSGTLGDMACHYMDLPFWALDLTSPLTVETDGPPVHPETAPPWMIVRCEFPARGDRPPVTHTWYDGGKRPAALAKPGMPKWGDGVLFVGDKGMLLADYDRYRLLPEEDFKGFSPPAPTIPSSIGHHAEWVDACKTGRPTTCNFQYSGALTETVLLGVVAYRVGRKIEWNAAELKAVNCPEAEKYLRREYRKGWIL